MHISPVSTSQRAAVLQLLQRAALPTTDIGGNVALYALLEDGEIIGAIGLERFGATGLLRSLCVDENRRGKNYGGQLVNFLEAVAKERGVQTLYLLTTTAAAFFAGKGYTVEKRADVPSPIQNTNEFSSLCPSSATVMKKNLK